MVNALAHRDYSEADPTRFTSFSDRIEIVSPGPLPLGISLQDLRKRTVTPRWRNQSLAWFLNRLQLAQAEGQGILTIRRTMKAIGCPPPRFDATEAWVSCVLGAHPRFQGLREAASETLELRSEERPKKPTKPKKRAAPKKAMAPKKTGSPKQQKKVEPKKRTSRR
jgi:ATP-dependent DNA helicase RecG